MKNTSSFKDLNNATQELRKWSLMCEVSQRLSKVLLALKWAIGCIGKLVAAGYLLFNMDRIFSYERIAHKNRL